MFQTRQIPIFLTFLLTIQSTIIDEQIQQHSSILDDFKQCLITKPTPSTTISSLTTFGYCFSVGAVNKLQTIDNNPEFDLIDGLRFSRNQQEFRDEYNFAERDPADFRTVVDSLNYVFTRRNLHWDMDFIYPGLSMQIAPSITPGGVLEFNLDPHREILNKHHVKEISSGRLLARQFLVPMLLGFKFNIATIVPILFGILALLAKKAVLISKIALIFSSAYALSSLVLGPGTGPNKYQNYQQYDVPAYTHFNHYRYQDNQNFYRDLSGPNQENNVDQFRLHDEFARKSREGAGNGRNFAWSEDEKLKKNSNR